MGNYVARCVGLVAVISLVTAAGAVESDDVEPAPEVKAHYEEGKARFAAGEFEEAIAAFTAAYNLTGEPNLLFNLAACAERLGDAERAIAYYKVYLEEMPDAEDAGKVRERVHLLETEGIPAPEEEAPPEQAPDEETPPEPEEVTPPPPDVDPAEYYKKEEEQKRVIWPALTIGGGAFVVAGGITTAILARKEYKGLENSCKPDCTDEEIKTAKALAIATDVQLILGGAAVAAGVVGLVLTKKRVKESRSALRIAPAGVPGGGVLVIGGRF